MTKLLLLVLSGVGFKPTREYTDVFTNSTQDKTFSWWISHGKKHLSAWESDGSDMKINDIYLALQNSYQCLFPCNFS